MLIEDETLALQEADFPSYFVKMHHPDDYIPINYPIEIEKIYHKRPDHNRLILRISVKISTSTFIPVCFICDTGAPNFVYINSITRRLIDSRILEDDAGTEYIYINNNKMVLKSSSSHHPDVNIIGLKGLDKFGLFVKNGEFDFEDLPNYF